MDLMGLKSKILDDILEEMDNKQGMGLKPKASISVTSVKPGLGGEPDGDENPLEAMGGQSHDGDDMSDEDLRRLIEEYTNR